jgi:hypothetical protein
MRSNHGSCGKKVATLNAVLMLPASKMPPGVGDAAAASKNDDDDEDEDEKSAAESTTLSNAVIGRTIDAMAATSSSDGASARRAGVRDCRRARRGGAAKNADDGCADANHARHVIEAEGRHIL